MKQKVVEITQVKGSAELPPFIPLAHRHFQKSLPFVADTRAAKLNINVDLLDLLLPARLLNEIEEITIEYQK